MTVMAGPSGCVTNRAVSLNVLESVVKSGASKEALRLCGITRVSGYVVDKQGRDIILFGKVDPSYPTLHLEDFIVALRNVRLAYARKRGHTYYYSPPGCSIDPNPQVLRELQAIGDRVSQTADPEERHRLLQEWEVAGRQPQSVRVLGVPFYTRFAKVMVDADYYMKRLVNGSVDLGHRRLLQFDGRGGRPVQESNGKRRERLWSDKFDEQVLVLPRGKLLRGG